MFAGFIEAISDWAHLLFCQMVIDACAVETFCELKSLIAELAVIELTIVKVIVLGVSATCWTWYVLIPGIAVETLVLVT